MANLQCNSKDDVRSLLEASFSAEGLLLEHTDLGENFFDLSSGVVGELFQTFNNYGKKLALVVPDSSIYSLSFQQLVLEHQYHSSIRFLPKRKLLGSGCKTNRERLYDSFNHPNSARQGDH